MNESTKQLIRILSDAGFHRWEYKASVCYLSDASASANFKDAGIQKAIDRADDLKQRGLKVGIFLAVSGHDPAVTVYFPKQKL